MTESGSNKGLGAGGSTDGQYTAELPGFTYHREDAADLILWDGFHRTGWIDYIDGVDTT